MIVRRFGLLWALIACALWAILISEHRHPAITAVFPALALAILAEGLALLINWHGAAVATAARLHFGFYESLLGSIRTWEIRMIGGFLALI